MTNQQKAQELLSDAIEALSFVAEGVFTLATQLPTGTHPDRPPEGCPENEVRPTQEQNSWTRSTLGAALVLKWVLERLNEADVLFEVKERLRNG